MLEIRLIHESDAEQVNSIFDLYWRGMFRDHLLDKLHRYFTKDEEPAGENFKFFVAIQDEEVVGVTSLRDAPDTMTTYSKTSNPGELYVIAVKEKGKGVGKALVEYLIQEAVKQKYTEIVVFSGVSHSDIWSFHDLYADRVDESVAPNGEPGLIWRREL